jgi:outer membrane lipoprotein-sorting protein
MTFAGATGRTAFAIVASVAILGGRKTEVVSLQITEASGDTTSTQWTDIRKNADVPDTEIAAAFGAS